MKLRAVFYFSFSCSIGLVEGDMTCVSLFSFAVPFKGGRWFILCIYCGGKWVMFRSCVCLLGVCFVRFGISNMMGEEGEKTTSEEVLELFLAQPVRRVVDLFFFVKREWLHGNGDLSRERESF